MEIAALGLRVDGVGGIDEAAAALEALTAASLNAERAAAEVEKASKKTKPAVESVATASDKAATSVDSLAAAETAAAAANDALASSSSKAKSQVDSTAQASAKAASSAAALSSAQTAAATAAEGFSAAGASAAQSVSSVTRASEEASLSVGAASAASAKAAESISTLAAYSERAAAGVEHVSLTSESAASAVDTLSSAAEAAGSAADAVTQASEQAAPAVAAVTAAAAGGATSLTRLAGSATQAKTASESLGQSVQAAQKPIEDVGEASEQSASRVNNLATVATRAGAVIGAAFSVRAIQQYADGWSDMQSRVGAATKDMAGAAGQMQRLVDIANASYSPLEQTVGVYSRNVAVLQDMGRSAAEAADFTESLNHMLVLTATRGQQAASVQDALAKAMAVGRLQADGLETVLANGGEVAAALARELNTNVNSLREFATQGKITGDVIATAITGSLDDVSQRAALMPATIGDAFTRVNTNITQFVGQIANATGAANAVSGTVMELADVIQVLGNNIGDVLTVSLAAGSVALTRYAGGLGVAAAASLAKTAATTREAAADLAKAKATDLAAQANVREATTAVASAQAAVAQTQANMALLGSRASMSAAVGVLSAAEARLIATQTAATASTTALAAAQTAATRSSVGLLAVLTGPVGLAVLTAGVAAGFLLMRDRGEDAATTLDRLATSTDGLTAAQLRQNQAKAEEAVEKLRKAAEEAQGELQGMQRDYDELGKLFDRGVITDAELRNVNLALNDAQANVDSANQALARGESVVQRYAAALDGLTASAKAAGPALVQTSAESMKFLESLESRAALAGITTMRGQLDKLVEIGEHTFSPEHLARAQAAADRYDRVTAAAKGTKSALDSLSTAEFGRTAELEAAKVSAAVDSLNVAWNAGRVGAERYYSRQIALTQQAAQAQQAAIQKEIAALGRLRQTPAVVERAAAAQNKLTIARIESASELERLRAEEDAYFRGTAPDNIRSLDTQTRSLEEQNVALQDQIDFFGLAASEISALRAARLTEAIAQQQANLVIEQSNQNREDEVERINAVIAALYNLRAETERRAGLQSRSERQDAEKELIDAQVKSWGQGIDTVNEMFVEGFRASLDRNGNAFKAFTDNIGKTLQNSVATAIYEATIKPVVIRFVAQLAGGLAGADVQSGILKNAGLTGSGSPLGLLTNFGGSVTNSAAELGARISQMNGPLQSLGTSMYANAEAIGRVADFAGDVVGYGKAIYDLTKGNYGAAAGSAIGTYFGGPIGSFIGSQLGGLLDGAFAGETRSGGSFVLDNGQAVRTGGPSGGADSAVYQFSEQLLKSTTGMIERAFSAAEIDASVANMTVALESSDKGRGGVFSFADVLMAGQSTRVGAVGRGAGYGSNSGSIEEMMRNLEVDAYQTVIQALQVAVDEFPPAIRAMIDGVDADSLGLEAAQALLGGFLTGLEQARNLADVLADLPWAPAAAGTLNFASALIEAAGGADRAAGLLGDFYQAYWTEAERMADLTGNLTSRFADLGMVMPTSLEQMRAQIQANMALGEAGASATASLLALAPELATLIGYTDQLAAAISQERLGLEGQLLQLTGDTAELRRRELEVLDPSNRALQERIWALQDAREAETALTTAIDAATRAAREMTETTWQLAVSAVNDAMDAVVRAVQSARDAAQTAHNTAMQGYQTQLQAAQRAASELSSVFGTLTSAVRSMRLESQEFEQLRRQGAQAQISEALARARAGGSLRDLDLGDALSVAAQNSTGLFSSYADYAVDWARTAHEVLELQTIAGKQLSFEERTVTALERQIDLAGRQHEAELARLQALIDESRAQVDAALGIDTSVMTVQQAIVGLGQTLTQLVATPRPTPGSGSTAGSGGVPAAGSVVDGWYTSILGRPADAGGAAYWESQIRQVGHEKALADFLYSARGVGELKAFARGGLASRGMALVGEEGPELVDFTSQGRVYPAGQTRQMLAPLGEYRGRSNDDTARLLYQLQILANDNQMMRAELQAIAYNTGRTAKMIDRAMPEGNAIVTRPLETETA